jgi:hypothetical protein
MSASIKLINHPAIYSRYWSYGGPYDEGHRSSVSAELPAGCPHIPDIDWTNLARPHGLNVKYHAGALWVVWVNPHLDHNRQGRGHLPRASRPHSLSMEAGPRQPRTVSDRNRE